MKRLRLIKDAYGVVADGVNVSDYIDYHVLAANVAETHTVPQGAKYVLFSANVDFYVKFGGAAVVPAADVTNGSGSMLNPTLRSIDGVTTIGLIAPTAAIVGMEFYS